ncbi:MAG: ABC transporter substrate-binding protein [Acidobacteria bacterium]|nr:ABC transporter substrate-binding protein [Acidobacteriota bacterium]
MKRRLANLSILWALVAVACGGAAAESTTTVAIRNPTTTVVATTAARPTTTANLDTGFPVTLSAANGDVVLDTRPTRIISISPTATEMLFALGAGDQVVAVDEFSTFPESAPVTDLSGFQPSVEAIASYEPDLVVVSFDPNDLVASLAAVGIPVLLAPSAATLEDVFAQIEQLGTATGNIDGASELVASMRADIDEIVAGLVDVMAAPTYYHELGPELYTATSATFIGEVYAILGFVNIADAADVDGFGFPQLSGEWILDQNPDFIFLADTICCGASAESVAERPGWDGLAAVISGRVVELDDDIASRWGPRVVDLLRVIAAVVNDVATAES